MQRPPAAAPRRVSPDAGSTVSAEPRSAQYDDVHEPHEDPQSRSSRASQRAYSSAGDVHIHRVLVGGQVLDAGVVSQAVFREHDRGDRYLVYFDIDVDIPGVRYEDFRLEDGKGLIYEPIRTHDALGSRNVDGASRGGVAFAVFNDAAPARLLRRSGPDSFAALPQSVFEPGR